MKDWKRQRTIDSLNRVDKRYYIFCEGTKTEPNYFKGIKEKIESKAIYRNTVFVEIEGIGKGTTKVLEYAQKYVNDKRIVEAEIWLVYDKDDFTANSFNHVSSEAERISNDLVKYNVAWSNQCIEYWFVLHFSYYSVNNDRKYYIDNLNKVFAKLELGRYKKNSNNIFYILEKYGDSDNAVKFAEKRLKEMENVSDALKSPATKVHLLYLELRQYF